MPLSVALSVAGVIVGAVVTIGGWISVAVFEFSGSRIEAWDILALRVTGAGAIFTTVSMFSVMITAIITEIA